MRYKPSKSLTSCVKAALLARLDPGLAIPVEPEKNAGILSRSLSFLTTAILGLLEPLSVAYGNGVAIRNWL
ncbi:MAG: hypothetical protein DRH70_09400, partial [Candidatus Coatesbacteria bacterium]